MSTNFREAIIQAMKRACDDMLRFTGEPAEPLNSEYLFTVAVAKQIDGLNSYYGDPYRIYLEKKTREFSKDCLHPIKFGSALQKGSTKFRKSVPALSRNGRIDIAIYEDIPNNGYLGHQPICAIELKGFNPARSLVLKDLRRNLEYFSLQGETGNSVLGSTLFGALHSWSKVDSEHKEDSKLEALKKSYEGWLSELPKASNVRSAVTVHQVSRDLKGEVVDEGDYQVLNADTIHNFAGIVVEFSVNKI